MIACCILSKFYIKPQRSFWSVFCGCVVSYRNSTSNHNAKGLLRTSMPLYLIEILHQTTTPLPFDWCCICCILSKFYIKPQPETAATLTTSGCILSKFYIKPQHPCRRLRFFWVVSYRNSTSNHNFMSGIARCIGVVSYRNSTSNHNFGAAGNIDSGLYLIEILHQTTTVQRTA